MCLPSEMAEVPYKVLWAQGLSECRGKHTACRRDGHRVVGAAASSTCVFTCSLTLIHGAILEDLQKGLKSFASWKGYSVAGQGAPP